MSVVSMENVSVFIPLILRGKVSGSGGKQSDDKSWAWLPRPSSSNGRVANIKVDPIFAAMHNACLHSIIYLTSVLVVYYVSLFFHFIH